MFSVAGLLDRAKRNGQIESDYRLAKVLGINQSAIGNYRAGRSLPDARILGQLCALSGDDVDVMAAQVQAEREKTAEGRALWLKLAARLQGGAATVASAIFSLVLALLFIAGTPGVAQAVERHPPAISVLENIYIASGRLLSRLRWRYFFTLWRVFSG